jgi:hypothetical protein
MPRGKEFCPCENRFFDVGEFEFDGGTRVHKVGRRHRATDGVLVHKAEGKVIPVMDFASAQPVKEASEVEPEPAQ